MRRLCGFAALAALGLSAAGCADLRISSPSPPTPDAGATPIGEPAAGFVFIRGDPPTAAKGLAVRLYQENPDTGPIRFLFEPGERVVGLGDGLPGEYLAAVDEVLCAGTIELVPRQETDALVSVDGDGSCEILAKGRHDTSVEHTMAAIGGRIVGAFPPNSVVRAVSRDVPPNPVPEARGPDEGGAFFFPSLLPGGYDIELLSGSSVLGREAVDLHPGVELLIELAVER